jgi:hypothetical protein
MTDVTKMDTEDLEYITEGHSQETNGACECAMCIEYAGRMGWLYDLDAKDGSTLPPNGRA